MIIHLTESFQRDVRALSVQQQGSLMAVLLKLPSALKDPHRHGGVGVRKIHASGIYEARSGLDLRIVFGFRDGALFCHRAGNHDDIRRYLKSL